MTEREKLEQVIQSLEAQRVSLGDFVVDAALASIRQKLAELESAEGEAGPQLKYVTVLFTDVVGSTKFSQDLDPEDILAIMDTALGRFTGVVEAHGGRVLRYMGDGLMAAFGVPVMQDTDPEQAVRAGLGILEEARSYAPEVEARWGLSGFKVRVGLNTGPVVMGGGLELDHNIMGMAVNLAARMETSAPPNNLLISHDTYRHVRGLVDVQIRPLITVKGKDEPIQTYLVTGVRSRISRVSSRGVEGIETILVGRENELSRLKETFERVAGLDQLQVVTIIGDPGIGKTRLVSEFEKWVISSSTPPHLLKGAATQQMEKSPYNLLREAFSWHTGILESDTAMVARQKFEEGLACSIPDEPEMKAHFIGALLGIDFSDSPHLVGVKSDPKQLRDRALFYIRQYLEVLSQSTPILMILDGIQWIDRPSLEALLKLISECGEMRLMIVCLSRPGLSEVRPEWEEFQEENPSRCTRIELTPLSSTDSRYLVNALLKMVENIPMELADLIVASAEGNPFYIEELINMLIDDKIIVREVSKGAWQIDSTRLSELRIPPTLTAVLQSRSDSLPSPVKITLQQASVVGRTFWDRALQALRDSDQPPVDQLLILSRRGMIIPQDRSTFESAREYDFKHLLFRDVVYETILKEQRQAYHANVAEWLTEATQVIERQEEFAAIIAEHYDQAGENALAADWYIRAGTRASSQAAVREARQFFDKALSLLPASDLRKRWEALLGRDEALGILGESQARLADDIALVSLAQEIGDDNLLAEAYIHQGWYLGITGEGKQGLEVYNAALAAAKRAGNLQAMALVLPLIVTNLTQQGKIDQAAELVESALNLARESGDEITLARALANLFSYYTAIGDFSLAIQMTDEQIKITHGLGNRIGESIGLMNQGYHFIVLGLYAQGRDASERALKVLEEMGSRHNRAFTLLNLGLVMLRLEDLQSAQERLNLAQPDLSAVGDIFGQAAYHLYLGMVLERSGQTASALHSFLEARRLYEEMGGMGYSYDARAGLARCFCKTGELEQAGEHARAVWEYLKQYGPSGMEFPILAYQTCGDIFGVTG